MYGEIKHSVYPLYISASEFSGIPLDVAIIREPEQSHIAVLAQVQDKTTVTLLLVPHHILDKGTTLLTVRYYYNYFCHLSRFIS